MVMLVYQRASVHCRDGHKVGRLLLSKHTKNIHRTPVDSIYQDLLSSSKKTSSNIIKPDIMLIDIIQQKKGIGPPIKKLHKKKAAIHTPTMTILFIGTYKPAVKDGDPLLLATNESGRNWNHLSHEQNPG